MTHPLLLLLSLLAGCSTPPPANSPPPEPKAADCPGIAPDPNADQTPTTITMQDVELVMPEGLLRVRNLHGTVKSTVPGQPPTIDDPKGYRISVDRAEVAVDTQTLNQMMSADHSTGTKAPLASADFTTEGELLVITGKQPVPFVLKGAMSVDPKGRLTITVVDLKALGVQTKGILKVLDLKLADLIDVSNQRGVTVDGNVVHVDPLVNMVTPKVDAKVTGVSVEADGLVLRLGDQGTQNPLTPTSESAQSTADTPGSLLNYVAYKGGTVIQGKMTIRETALTLIDLDTSDPLRLAISSIRDQIAACYTKLTPSGMNTFLPDSNQIDGVGATPGCAAAPVVPAVPATRRATAHGTPAK